MRTRSLGAGSARALPLPAAAPRARPRAAVPARARAPTRWGWLPAISLLSALGLLSLSAANWLSATGGVDVEPLFWLGLLTIVLPASARLLSARATRAERLGLVLLLGINLYGVKVLQSPFAFTYSDEFIHLYNLNQIVATGRLFASNPILPATPLYPGLETAAAALVQLAGLNTFSAGLIVVGLARAVLMLALFLFFEQLTGSARVAGLASLLYAANDNFLFWSVSFSYESLALPLAVLVLYVVARRESGRVPGLRAGWGVASAERVGLTLAALLMIAAVVVTHHMTSYFLAAILLLWAVLAWLARAGHLVRAGRLWARLTGRLPLPAWQPPGAATGGPGGLVLFAALAAVAWLIFAASLTLNYLSPLFGKALISFTQMITGETTGRALFQSTGGGYVTPLWERVVSLGAVALCLLGLPLGLWQVWRRYRGHPLVLLLAGGAVLYFALLGLRFIPSTWEIANRSSEFLFIGLALVLGLIRLPSGLRLWGWWRPLAVAAIGTIFTGGLIAGWLPQLRVAQVAQVDVAGQRLVPPGLSAAQWSLEYLGPNHKFVADEAAGRYLMAYGDQQTLVGRQQSVSSIFQEATLHDWQIQLLFDSRIEYLAADRRLIGGDNMLGFFFDRGSSWPPPPAELLAPEVYVKFDQLRRVSRVYDSGDLVLYDLRSWLGGPVAPLP